MKHKYAKCWLCRSESATTRRRIPTKWEGSITISLCDGCNRLPGSSILTILEVGDKIASVDDICRLLED